MMMGKEHVLTKRSECTDADCRESGYHVASKFSASKYDEE